MLFAEQVMGNPLANYGILGLVTTLFATWLTLIGKWVIKSFTKELTDSRGVIERNTAVMDSWKRTSEGLVASLEQFNHTAAECRKVITKE
jgi:hypothetical protein